MTVSSSENPAGRDALPLYLGPQLARWTPRTIADVRAAIDDGTLAERHWIDVKREIGTSDGAKKETARDLASFANDGGALLVGVEEDKATQQLVTVEQELTGLGERVEQIARSRIDPPLYVVTTPLPGTGRDRGVLLVEVPPSTDAPHQVDGRYWGRGDKTKYPMPDPEVARLHALRSARQLTAEQVIAGELERDPVRAEHRELSHLFVAAEPLTSPPDLLTALISDPRGLNDLLNSAAYKVPFAGSAVPNWGYISTINEPRAGGVGFRSSGLVGRRHAPELGDMAQEGNLLDVEVADNGRVAFFCGRASYPPRNVDEQLVVEALVLILTRTVVTIAGRLGGHTGYAGRWLLAVGVTDLLGKRSSNALNSIGFEFPPYSAEEYVQGTEATTRELLDRPGAVTRRLTGRLLRGLGVDRGQYDQLLTEAP